MMPEKKQGSVKIKLPESYRIFFWDVDWSDLKKNADHFVPFIIARLADKGDVEQVRWLKANFSIHEIVNSVKAFRFVSAKTLTYWSRYAKTA